MEGIAIEVIIQEIAGLGTNALQMGQNIDERVVEYIDIFHRIAIMPVASVLLALFAVMQIYRMVSVLNDASAPQGGSARYETLGLTFVKIGFLYMLVLNMKDFIWGLVAAGNFLMQKIHEAGAHIQGIDSALLEESIRASIDNKNPAEVIGDLLASTFGIPSFLLVLCLLILKIAMLVVFVLFYSRLLKIYIMAALAPIPVVTFLHEEHRQIGVGFVKSFCATVLQGAVMLLCIYLYSAVISSTMFNMGNINTMLLAGMGIAALLVVSLATSGTLAKKLVNAM